MELIQQQISWVPNCIPPAKLGVQYLNEDGSDVVIKAFSNGVELPSTSILMAQSFDLPPGLEFQNSAQGKKIVGTPTHAQNNVWDYPVYLKATDENGFVGYKTY